MPNETRRARGSLRKLVFQTRWPETLECDLPIQEHLRKNSERTNCSSALIVESKPTLQVGFELSQRLLSWRIAPGPVRSNTKGARLSTHCLEAASLKSLTGNWRIVVNDVLTDCPPIT